jgi:hypothetical protein
MLITSFQKQIQVPSPTAPVMKSDQRQPTLCTAQCLPLVDTTCADDEALKTGNRSLLIQSDKQ